MSIRVAYDPRPVLGGKVVIQAKRYKNTVGVSAVRDLFGTVHNEGASKASGDDQRLWESLVRVCRGQAFGALGGLILLYMLGRARRDRGEIQAPTIGKTLWRSRKTCRPDEGAQQAASTSD